MKNNKSENIERDEKEIVKSMNNSWMVNIKRKRKKYMNSLVHTNSVSFHLKHGFGFSCL